MKTKLLLCVALIMVSFEANAALAFLVSQHYSTSVTGRSVTVCVYRYANQSFNVTVPVGQMCQPTFDVQ